jgi:hypothetical protein
MQQRDDSTSDWDFGFDFGAGFSDEQTDRGDDVPADDGPIRKGGGPPGRSAFLPGGRLRPTGRDRGPTTGEVPEPAPTAFRHASDAGAAASYTQDQAFRPVSEWVFDPGAAFAPEPLASTLDEPSAPPTSTASDSPYESFSSFDAFGPDPLVESPPEAPRPVPGRTFPGGRAKLPRLNPDVDAEAEVDYVSTAFIPRRGPGEDENGRPTGFHGYNTYESLFVAAVLADPLTKLVHKDAYEVLGVSREDDWKVVVSAHRKLVKANHPDGLSDASPAVRQEAEERLRQINLAYREVKETRREEGRPTTSAETDADGLDED